MRKPSDKTEIDSEHKNHKMPADDFSSAGMKQTEKLISIKIFYMECL